METSDRRETWNPDCCSELAPGAPVEKNLLCYWQPGAIGNNLAKELVASSWKILPADNPVTVKNLCEQHKVPVGMLFLDSNLETPELNDIYDVINDSDDMVWLALLNDRRRMNDPVCNLIATYCNDFFTPPYDSKRILEALGHAVGLSRIRHRNLEYRDAPSTFHGMIGESSAMRSLFRQIRKVARSNAPVLLIGESGTGKELAANAIHRLSSRAARPLVAINCAALPSSLIQAELFGHEKGAFTGAGQRRVGRFEAADGGVLFLDEISDMPLDQQVNLLRFLEDNQIERLGGNGNVKVDVRIVAATHDDLSQAVADGKFREDLYYRLNVLQIELPSLRERATDIELLAGYFLEQHGRERDGQRIKGFDQRAQAGMRAYHWPGNVRELINRVRGAIVMAEGGYISARDLGLGRTVAASSQSHTLEINRAECDKRTIEAALQRCHQNMSRAARELGISRTTLYRMMEKLAIRA